MNYEIRPARDGGFFIRESKDGNHSQTVFAGNLKDCLIYLRNALQRREQSMSPPVSPLAPETGK